MSGAREYDLIVFGATGFTGKLVAEYIQKHVATDLKWAIAGRSRQKLQAVADELKTFNADRLQPGVEISDLDRADLDALAGKTKVLITTVGPYHAYGTKVVEACISSRTHYLDVTGETPWVYDMFKKNHKAAKEAGIVVIPQCGIDSVPADILAYVLAHHVRSQLNMGITECVGTLQAISDGVSGGTANTLFTITEAFSIPHLLKSMTPHSLSDVPPPKNLPGEGIVASVIGSRVVEDLGILTDSMQGATDVTIVNRSWSLFDGGKFYGPRFNYSEWMRVRSRLMGALVHYLWAGFLVSLYIPGMRWLMKRMVHEPGQGPSRERSAKGFVKYKTIAKPEGDATKRGVATLEFKGGMYWFTAISVTEAALTLLKGGDVLAKRLCGLVTTATLEMEYVERLRKAGIKINVGLEDRSSRL